MTWLLLASQVLHGGATRDQSVTWVNSLPCVTGAYRGTHASWPFPDLPNSNPSGIMMKIRIASTLLPLALPLVAQEPAAAQVEAMFYKAYYLEKGPRQFEEASVLYEKFLTAAPEHKLAAEAAKQQFRLLDRTGKTKERDAFKTKYSKLLGDISATPARPAPGEGNAGDRPERGARPEGGERPEGGGRGQRGAGGRRGGIMGLMRNETKIADMSKEQLEELKTGLEGAGEMIERMRPMMGEEAADKMAKGAADLKKALDAGKNEEAQKAMDELKAAFPTRGGRGGGDAGGAGRRPGGGGGRPGGGGGGQAGGGGGGGN